MPNYKNTTRMFYDINKHRYILTPTAISQDLNISLQDYLLTDESVDPDREPEVFLNDVSRVLYNYIYQECGKFNKAAVEYKLSLSQYRDAIEEALIETARSILQDTNRNTFKTDINYMETVPMVRAICENNDLIFRGCLHINRDSLNRKGEDY